MSEKTVVVRYIARGSRQVGRQVLGMAHAHSAAAGEMAGANQKAALSAKGLATASAVMGKVILLGIGAALAVSTKAAIDFEASMAEVAKTLDFDLHSEQYNEVADALLKMSETTPVNVNELASIAAIGGQLGIPIDNIIEFTEVIAAMGVSTNLSSTEAAKGMARFMNIMGTSYNDFERIGSIIVDLGNNFATTESEILTFATRLAPIGAVVGATEEEVLGLATAFSQMGVPAERGATAIQRVFIDIERAVESGGIKMGQYARVAGMTIEEFGGATAIERLQGFIDGLANIEDTGGSALGVLKDLGINQQRTIAVLLAAASNADGFADALNTANQAGEESSALFEEAAKRYGTTASHIQLMANSFNALRIELGGSFIGAAKAMTDWMRDLFAGLRDNIGALKAFIAVLGGIAVVKILLAAATAVIHLKDAFVALKTSMMAGGALQGLGLISKLTMALPGIAGAAILAFGGLSMVWARNAREARELEEAVKQMADVLENAGATDADKESTITEILEKDGVALKDLREELNSLDVPMSAFIEAWAGGAEEFEEFIQMLIAKEPLLAEFFAGEWGGTRFELDAQGRVDRTKADIELQYRTLFNAVTRGEAVLAATEAELAARRRDRSLDVSSMFGPGTRNEHMGIVRDIVEGNKVVSLSFWETTQASDDAASAWEDYYNGVSDGMDDMVEAIHDGFADIADDVRDSVDPWDDAFKATEIIMSDWIANLEAQVSAVEEWTAFMGEADLSAGARSFMDEWGLAEKAGFIGMSEAEQEKMIAFIEETYGTGGRLDTVAKTLQERSGVVADAVAEFLTITAEDFEKLKAEGIDPVEAWATAIEDNLEDVPEELRPAVLEAMKVFMAGEGGIDLFGEGALIVQGLLDGMESKIDDTSAMARRLKNSFTTTFENQWRMESPSKVMEQYGKYVVQGFTKGIASEAVRAFPNMPAGGGSQNYLSPDNVIGSMGGSSTTTNSAATTVIVQDSKTNDLRTDISAGLIAAGVTRQVEVLVKK